MTSGYQNIQPQVFTSNYSTIEPQGATSPLILPLDFVVSRYVMLILTLLSVYLLVALGIYTWKTRKRRDVPKVNHLTLVSATLALVLCLFKLGALWNFGLSCFTYLWTSSLCYSTIMSLIYTILWARQRRLYSNRLSAYNDHKIVKGFSGCVIIIIYLFFIAAFVSVILFNKFITRQFPCKVVWVSTAPTMYTLIISGVFVPLCFLFQFSLFALIVAPILHKDGVTACSIVFYKSNKDIHRLIFRLGLCAIACFFSSVPLALVIVLNAVRRIDLHDSSFVALNVIVSIVATIFTFVDWKKRLFPFFQDED